MQKLFLVGLVAIVTSAEAHGQPLEGLDSTRLTDRRVALAEAVSTYQGQFRSKTLVASGSYREQASAPFHLSSADLKTGLTWKSQQKNVKFDIRFDGYQAWEKDHYHESEVGYSGEEKIALTKQEDGTTFATRECKVAAGDRLEIPSPIYGEPFRLLFFNFLGEPTEAGTSYLLDCINSATTIDPNTSWEGRDVVTVATQEPIANVKLYFAKYPRLLCIGWERESPGATVRVKIEYQEHDAIWLPSVMQRTVLSDNEIAAHAETTLTEIAFKDGLQPREFFMPVIESGTLVVDIVAERAMRSAAIRPVAIQPKPQFFWFLTLLMLCCVVFGFVAWRRFNRRAK